MKASELVKRINNLMKSTGDVFIRMRTGDSTHTKEINNIYRDLFGNITIE